MRGGRRSALALASSSSSSVAGPAAGIRSNVKSDGGSAKWEKEERGREGGDRQKGWMDRWMQPDLAAKDLELLFGRID